MKKYIKLTERLLGINESNYINEAFASSIISDFVNGISAVNWAEVNEKLPLAWDKIKDSDITELDWRQVYDYEDRILNRVSGRTYEKGYFYKKGGTIRELIDILNKYSELKVNMSFVIDPIIKKSKDLANNYFNKYGYFAIIDVLFPYYKYKLSSEYIEIMKEKLGEDNDELNDIIRSAENVLKEYNTTLKQLEYYGDKLEELRSDVKIKDVDGVSRKVRAHPVLFCMNHDNELAAIVSDSELVWSIKRKTTGNPRFRTIKNLMEQEYDKFYFIDDATPFLTQGLRDKRSTARSGALALQNVDDIVKDNLYRYKKILKDRKYDEKFESEINIETIYTLFNSCVDLAKGILTVSSFEDYKKNDKILSDLRNLNNEFYRVGNELNWFKSTDYKEMNYNDLKRQIDSFINTANEIIAEWS